MEIALPKESYYETVVKLVRVVKLLVTKRLQNFYYLFLSGSLGGRCIGGVSLADPVLLESE